MSELVSKIIAYRKEEGVLMTFIKEAYISYLNEYEEFASELEPLMDISEFQKTFNLEDYIYKITKDRGEEYYVEQKEDYYTIIFYHAVESCKEGESSGISIDELIKLDKKGYDIFHTLYYNGGTGELDIILERI